MAPEENVDRRRIGERRLVPRGGRRADDAAATERSERERRALREQQVVKYLRKQDPK